ncbi:hypothetical protein [Dyadobacter sp.]|uniref:hypothetical protein n=1 Tax=Dyadobacter sp. TaxID=1914288 RepID=UPI003F71DE02
MKYTLLSFLVLLLACTDKTAQPGEVAGTITGFLEVDDLGKGCGTSGLVLSIEKANYLISNEVEPRYQQPNAWPVQVWVRFKLVSPDRCSQSGNSVEIVSIRERK